MITALLLVASLEINPTILSGTTWTETANKGSSEIIECPIRFEFVGTKYRYINDCTGKGGNKIVEFGKYVVSSSSVILTDRRVVVGAGSVFGEDAKQITLKLVHHQPTSMTLAFGEFVLTLNMVGQVEW